jgi:hypothetical protein
MAEDAGEQADDRVDDDGCREFAAGENVVADGKLFIAEQFADAFIDALITATDENNTIQLREAAGCGLGEALALCGEQNDGFASCVAFCFGCDAQRLDAIEDGFGLEHHAFAAAEGAVVDGAVTVMRKGAEVVGVRFRKAFTEGARDDSELKRTNKEVREDGDDVEAHKGSG